jgi:hypothetical protein
LSAPAVVGAAAPYATGESLGNAKDSRPYFCALQREIFLALSGIFATCGTLSLAADSAHSWNTVFSKDAVAGERHRVIFSSRCCRETCFSRRAGFFRPSSSTTRSRVPSVGIALCSLMPQSPCCVWSVATLITGDRDAQGAECCRSQRANAVDQASSGVNPCGAALTGSGGSDGAPKQIGS